MCDLFDGTFTIDGKYESKMIARIKIDFEMKTQNDQDTKQAFCSFLQKAVFFLMFCYILRIFDDTTGRKNKKVGQ